MSDFRYGLHPANPRRTVREEVAPAPMDIGSVVVLKSGGPQMTVQGKQDESFWTVWFDTTHQLHQALMLRDLLEAVR
jgi:uncharacterized protein YodC (DUF2158 family)